MSNANPNKSTNSKTNFPKPCGRCKLILHCAKEEEHHHWKKQKELCKAVSNLRRDKKLSDLFQKVGCPEARAVEDENCISLIVESKMNRDLTQGEKKVLFRKHEVCSDFHSEIQEVSLIQKENKKKEKPKNYISYANEFNNYDHTDDFVCVFIFFKKYKDTNMQHFPKMAAISNAYGIGPQNEVGQTVCSLLRD